MKRRHNSGSYAAGMDNITGPVSSLDLLKPDLVKYDENQVTNQKKLSCYHRPILQDLTPDGSVI